MKKVYLLTALLAFSSSAFAHPCNPNDKDFDPEKCELHKRPFVLPDEREPIDLDDIPRTVIPERDPFPDPRIPQDIPFGNPLGGF